MLAAALSTVIGIAGRFNSSRPVGASGGEFSKSSSSVR